MFQYENNCYNGDIGELIVATELVKNNIDVCKSLMNNKIYDFIIITNGGMGKTYKIQVKSSNTFNNKFVSFNLKATRLIKGKWVYKTYQENDIDYLFCVNNKTSDVFLLEPKDFINKTMVTFRYDKPAKQSKYFEDYLLKNTINKLS